MRTLGAVLQLPKMVRRILSLVLLLILLAPIAGAVSVAFECDEPCADDSGDGECPPVCTVCTACTHGQKAVVGNSAAKAPPSSFHLVAPSSAHVEGSPFIADVFHIPIA